MAIATTVPGYFANMVPKYNHTGVISVSGTTVFPNSDSATTVPTTGDIIHLAKLPDQAIIVDFEEDHTAADTVGIDFGLQTGNDTGEATFSSLIAAGAKATLNRRAVLNNSNGVKVSLSDSDPNGYAILAAKVASGSYTTTVTIRWSILYRMDGDPVSG